MLDDHSEKFQASPPLVVLSQIIGLLSKALQQQGEEGPGLDARARNRLEQQIALLKELDEVSIAFPCDKEEVMTGGNDPADPAGGSGHQGLWTLVRGAAGGVLLQLLKPEEHGPVRCEDLEVAVQALEGIVVPRVFEMLRKRGVKLPPDVTYANLPTRWCVMQLLLRIDLRNVWGGKARVRRMGGANERWQLM